MAILDTAHPRGTRTSATTRGRGRRRCPGHLDRGRSRMGGGRQAGREYVTDRWRAARLEDICILLPTRTSLPQLEPALDRHGIPYRIEAGSLIWASRTIRDVMAVVRSVADPTDEVALLNALRSPAFGCGDDDLYTFRVVHGGRWSFLASSPPSMPADHPVAEAMGWLAGLHHQVRWLSPSELIERIVGDRRLMESGCFGSQRPRDAWRSLQLVADQARQFEESAGGGLREFIAWVDRKVSERTRESDVILSETDDNAVRITTVHAAKGREFPIVILSGTYARSRYHDRQSGVALLGRFRSSIHQLAVDQDFRRTPNPRRADGGGRAGASALRGPHSGQRPPGGIGPSHGAPSRTATPNPENGRSWWFNTLPTFPRLSGSPAPCPPRRLPTLHGCLTPTGKPSENPRWPWLKGGWR